MKHIKESHHSHWNSLALILNYYTASTKKLQIGTKKNKIDRNYASSKYKHNIAIFFFVINKIVDASWLVLSGVIEAVSI